MDNDWNYVICDCCGLINCICGCKEVQMNDYNDELEDDFDDDDFDDWGYSSIDDDDYIYDDDEWYDTDMVDEDELDDLVDSFDEEAEDWE